MYNYFLFDLDGTITDSGIGIKNSIKYALEKLNTQIPDVSILDKFLGPPLYKSFENYFGMSEEQASEAVGIYREYYSEKGLFENEVYGGIPELLAELKNHGKKVILATSKPAFYAEKILSHFDLLKYFDFIAGSNMDGTRSKKNEVISYALEMCNITDLKSVVMIGDREHDIIGAKALQIDSVGVLYGYGDLDELQKAGAVHIVNDANELHKLLCSCESEFLIDCGEFIIRKHRESDIQDRLDLGRSKEFVKMCGGSAHDDAPLTYDKLRHWYENALNNKYDWVIDIDGKCVGTAKLNLCEDDNRARYSVGFFDESLFGKGFGTKVTKAVLKYAFETLKLHKVDLRVLEFNLRGIRCYEKCGFIKEGIEREGALIDGKYYSDVCMSILEQEYRELQVL